MHGFETKSTNLFGLIFKPPNPIPFFGVKTGQGGHPQPLLIDDVLKPIHWRLLTRGTRAYWLGQVSSDYRLKKHFTMRGFSRCQMHNASNIQESLNIGRLQKDLSHFWSGYSRVKISKNLWRICRLIFTFSAELKEDERLLMSSVLLTPFLALSLSSRILKCNVL